MSTKTLILAGNRIWEPWVWVPVSWPPCSVDAQLSGAPHSCLPLTLPFPSPLHLVTSWDRCSSSISNTKRKIHHTVQIWCQALDSWITSEPRSCRQALLRTDWLKCTGHLILKVYKRFNIQKLFFARVKLNNSYYVYKIPSMKNKGLSKLIKKEVLQKL